MSINAHTGSSSSRHYENMEESVRTRIAQIARNAIQEIDPIAQIVRTNEPSFSSARDERSSSSTSDDRSRATLMKGECSSHCAMPAPQEKEEFLKETLSPD